ncbi:hypothetical protein SS50377_21147 [Spironucleus salmonicida]|uniref:Uncharacterized protein n=1 Tax=Spironucleus salmonicida TaxID=348837 RepID=V6LT08_9EUKA|nr:hypothetical protein SS50377_21147 [Spironucleus salmonicida]|eukprot:EST43929.1 Hypothetical protein SS50377_16231 [Spironucleus salmonicida]
MSKNCFCNLVPDISDRLLFLEDRDKYFKMREQRVAQVDDQISFISQDLIQKSQEVKELSKNLPSSQIIEQQQQLIESLIEAQQYTQKLFQQVYKVAKSIMPLPALDTEQDQHMTYGLELLGSALVDLYQ